VVRKSASRKGMRVRVPPSAPSLDSRRRLRIPHLITVAKLGVGGSSPSPAIVLKEIRSVKRPFGAALCFPLPHRRVGEAGGSSKKRKAAGVGPPSAWAVTRSHGFPPPRQAAMAAPRRGSPFRGCHASPDADASGFLLPWVLAHPNVIVLLSHLQGASAAQAEVKLGVARTHARRRSRTPPRPEHRPRP
jgi:hypothetical protein